MVYIFVNVCLLWVWASLTVWCGWRDGEAFFFNLILGVMLWAINYLLLLLSQCCAPSLLCLWNTLP